MATLTAEQVLALAPDAAAASAGRGVASAGRWVSLGRSGQAVWGEYRGSGSRPYQTQADLGGPAYRCTCPSRKLPCKHALGLLLLLAGEHAAVPEAGPPGWVAEWLAARAERAARRTGAAARERPAAVPDPAAQARRAAVRAAKVEAGVAELGLLLRDVVRGGLAAPRPARFWEEAAARTVDAQAPGLAGRLRRIAGLPEVGEGWSERLLEELARLHLLVEAHRRIDQLPPATRADVRALTGWPQPKDELLARPGLRDRWGVVAHRVADEDRLRVQRTWLWGGRSGRPALLLDFAPAGQPLPARPPPGSGLDAELVFYPGSTPLRALVKAEHGGRVEFPAVGPGLATVEDAYAAHAAALAANPWAGPLPVVLDAVVPVPRRGWVLRDPAGGCLPLSPWFGAGWQLAALAGAGRCGSSASGTASTCSRCRRPPRSRCTGGPGGGPPSTRARRPSPARRTRRRHVAASPPGTSPWCSAAATATCSPSGWTPWPPPAGACPRSTCPRSWTWPVTGPSCAPPWTRCSAGAAAGSPPRTRPGRGRWTPTRRRPGARAAGPSGWRSSTRSGRPARTPPARWSRRPGTRRAPSCARPPWSGSTSGWHRPTSRSSRRLWTTGPPGSAAPPPRCSPACPAPACAPA